ncbi:MAG: nuclear transport factor 2 family protein [Acidimicrobiia bacterium]
MEPAEANAKVEERTRAVVERMYDSYFDGDADGMVDTMSTDVWVRFLGRVNFRGKDRARSFFGDNTPNLLDLHFRIRKLIVDGHHAAAVWEENATTVHGHPYENHGVDVFAVVGDEITAVHENNDIRIHRHHFGDGD